MRVLFIGERNPYGEHPDLALHPTPANASGDRLCKILGMAPSEYLARYDRTNLCVGPWSLVAAREVSRHLRLRRDLREHRFVLLGRNVQRAFQLEADLFQVTSLENGRPVLVLPHPSGVNRLWDVTPSAKARARRALRELERLSWAPA